MTNKTAKKVPCKREGRRSAQPSERLSAHQWSASAPIESQTIMSELLRAAKNKEWDKLKVRRPLEVVWGFVADRTALTAC